MNQVIHNFICEESRIFRFKLGSYVASSLAGFIAGVIVASIMWFAGAQYFKQAQRVTLPNIANQPVVTVPVSPTSITH
jgi:hypothetical protein